MGKPKTKSNFHGLLVVDKPLGWSSMDVVRHVRRAADFNKTGHAGTLDPLATGVVICCLGKATRCVEQLMGLTKVYEARVDLSAFTTTDDREGERTEIAPHDDTPPTLETLKQALAGFVGQIEQRPPNFSAIHVNGKRAYKLARAGEAVEIPSRTVRIDAIELLEYSYPLADIRVTCGRGTYIRSLARDLGEELQTGGHLAALRRTAVGGYTLAEAVTEERLEQPITQDDLMGMPEVDS